MDDFVAPDFWKLLSEEISGLRETLESGNEDEESPKTDPTPEPDDGASGAGAILFRNCPSTSHASFQMPSPSAQTTLLEIYRYRVESVYKVFHWPTVLQIFEQNQEARQTPIPVRALQCSIIFMAFCSITNEEAAAQDLGDRMEMLQLYQSVTEDMLARSQLLSGPDLITLQAFVVYLVRQHSDQTSSSDINTDPITRTLYELARTAQQLGLY